MSAREALSIRYLLLFLAMGALPASAQQPNGTIRGVVTDPEGLSVQGAAIRVESGETGYIWNSETDETGFFVVSVPPGDEYSAMVTAKGFQRYRQTDISMTVHGQVRLEVGLKLGDIRQEVVVQDRPPLLTTDDGRLKGEVISQAELVALPVLNRQYEYLALLVPGAVPSPEGADEEGSFFAANGARADQSTFYVDGVSNRSSETGGILVRPNTFAVREFRVETTGYSAKYGRYSGPAVQVVLRSGTNNLHGDFFEDLKNGLLNARFIFARRNDRAQGDLKSNQFGAALGGPIVIPSLYDGRNRSFFHFSYEGNRISRDQLRPDTALVPTLAEHQGDFSQSNKPFVKDPLTGQPFDNAMIPASRLDPIGLGAAELYPLPNDFTSPRSNWISLANERLNNDSLALKIDRQLYSQDRLSFRVQRIRRREWEPVFVGAEPAWGSDDRDRYLSTGISYTRSLSPALLLEAQFGFGRHRESTDPTRLGAEEARDIDIPVATNDPEFFGMPQLDVQGYQQIGPASNQPFASDNRDQQAHLSFDYRRGRHAWSWGVSHSRASYSNPRNANLRGSYSFSGFYSGQSVGDLLLGSVASSSRRREPGFGELITSSYAAFVNDDWRVSDRLTLNWGLRYAVNRPFVDKYDRLANFLPSIAKTVIADDRYVPDLDAKLAEYDAVDGVVLADAIGLPRALVDTDYAGWSPRLGFAWRPFGNASTVIRAGYGIFYAGMVQRGIRVAMGDSFPVAFIETLEPPPSAWLPLSEPFNSDNGDLQVARYAFEANPDSPYSQTWNFTIERALGRSTAVEVAYVGSKGTHLSRWGGINTRIRSLETFVPGQEFPTPDPRYDPTQYLGFDSNSNYHAGQFSLRRQAADGLFFRVNYTFSKSIDEASAYASDFKTQLTGDGANLNRGRSGFDRRHVFNLAWSWETPVGRGQRWLSDLGRGWDALLGGWQISGTTSLLSGAPFTVLADRTNPEIGESERPNRIGSGIEPGRPSAGIKGFDVPWFRASDFEKVPCALPSCAPSQYGFLPFQPGNSGRNILDRPGSIAVDIAMSKSFRLTEGATVAIRFEALNALNRTNLTGLNSSLGSNSVGYLQPILPRFVQLGLRLSF